MEREIKFRGKSLDNDEWIYGSLIRTTKDQCYIMEKRAFIPALSMPAECFIEVDPKTVGLYFDIDKEDTELYEGDIVNKPDGNANFPHGIYTIVFNSGCFAAAGETGSFVFFRGDIIKIGNIHDNPELSE